MPTCEHCDGTGRVDVKQRTDQQNRSLHLFFRLLAEKLNNAGWSKQKILRHAVDLDWDEQSVKYDLWYPLMRALTGKKSTAQLTKHEEIDKIYEHLNRFTAQTFGVHVDFPHMKEGEEDSAGRIKINDC